VSTLLNGTYRTEDKLRDGRAVVVRAIRPEDKPILQDRLHHLSPRSQYFRFLTPKNELTEEELVYFTEVDFIRHVALVANLRENGKEIAVGGGRYIIDNKVPDSAELAFTVADAHQGLGIATVLLRHLTELARQAGIRQFTALVLPDNQKMLRVFQKCGLPMQQTLNEVGVLEIVLKL